jgi:hypothetical protein
MIPVIMVIELGAYFWLLLPKVSKQLELYGVVGKNAV